MFWNIIFEWSEIVGSREYEDVKAIVSLFAGFFAFVVEFVAICKWFGTDHYSFWHGFKELIWATVPGVNVTYCWDWIVAGHNPFIYLASWFVALIG